MQLCKDTPGIVVGLAMTTHRRWLINCCSEHLLSANRLTYMPPNLYQTWHSEETYLCSPASNFPPVSGLSPVLLSAIFLILRLSGHYSSQLEEFVTQAAKVSSYR